MFIALGPLARVLVLFLAANVRLIGLNEFAFAAERSDRLNHARKRTKGNIGGTGKEIVFSLVERNGSVRSQHVPEVIGETLARSWLPRWTLRLSDDR